MMYTDGKKKAEITLRKYDENGWSEDFVNEILRESYNASQDACEVENLMDAYEYLKDYINTEGDWADYYV